MANKRFYWLKLQEDFFQEKAMKKLHRMEHGEVLTIIYLKMQLASLRNGGAIAFEGMDGSFAEELSYQIDEPEQDVQTTVDFLIRYGLMEQVRGGDIYILPKAVENTGSETDSAAHMRELRARASSQCDDSASHCSDIKRESIEDLYSEHIQMGEGESAAAAPPSLARDDNDLVLLSDADYDQLRTELGESELSRVISYLSGYCRLHGKVYPDWPFAIRKASVEGWGISSSKPGSKGGTDFQPTADRIQKNNAWLDSFLEQQKKPKWNLNTTKL